MLNQIFPGTGQMGDIDAECDIDCICMCICDCGGELYVELKSGTWYEKSGGHRYTHYCD